MNKTAFYKTICRLICFISVLCLSAEVADSRPSAQEVRITLSLREVSLKLALADIEKQSQYLFVNRGVDLSRKVTVELNDASIRESCEQLLTPLRVSFDIQKSNIIIADIPERESVAITGTILDGNGFPVPGAAVFESGTTNGTVTDLDGNYSLTVTGGGQRYRDKLPRL